VVKHHSSIWSAEPQRADFIGASATGSEAAIHLSGEAFARVEGRCRCVPLGPMEFKGGRRIVVYRHQHDEG
jgi:hypothetical protein